MKMGICSVIPTDKPPYIDNVRMSKNRISEGPLFLGMETRLVSHLEPQLINLLQVLMTAL